jgi:hypothetical protein
LFPKDSGNPGENGSGIHESTTIVDPILALCASALAQMLDHRRSRARVFEGKTASASECGVRDGACCSWALLERISQDESSPSRLTPFSCLL